MILSFSTKWPKGMPGHMAGKPNYFPEKIWRSLDKDFPFKELEDKWVFDRHGNERWDTTKSVDPKPHTIRRDEKDRWKAGNDIHFAINVRTKDQFQFAPVVKCVSTQSIHIEEKIMTVYDCIKLKSGRVFTVKVDGKYLSQYRIQELALNDGFNSVEDFFAWFNTDFTGKIIHWTDLKY